MNKITTTYSPLILFKGIATIAIIAGGTLAAFSSHAPTQSLVWASAFLVLVLGVAQDALAFSLKHCALAVRKRNLLLIFASYNLGALAVLFANLLKILWLVDAGGILLAFSLLLSLWVVRGAKFSWLLVLHYLVVSVLLISIPIGLFLAR